MHRLASTLSLLLLAVLPRAQANDETKKAREAADAAVQNADWETAIASYKKLVAADPKDGRAWHMLGYSLHANGDLDEALKAHLKAAEFPEVAPIASYNAACVYALRGKKDEALNWLEKAAEKGFNGADHMAGDTDMDSLREEARYKAIVAKIAKNSAQPGPVKVFAGTFDRKLARMVLFAGRGSVGGVSISYGQPQWAEKYDELIGSPKYDGKRWRFGKDEWTTLDTSVPLTLGDKELKPGVYYLTIEQRGGQFVLAAIDPASVHASTIDPYVAHLSQGGVETVLKHEKSDEVEKRLVIKLAQTMGSPGTGELVVRFGPHTLSAPIQLHPRAEK